MYASGIPMGIITDRKSPRLAAIIGMFALGLGYFPIYKGMSAAPPSCTSLMASAYDMGAGSMSVALIAFFSFLTGVGSCSAFQAALKIGKQPTPGLGHH